MPIVLFVAVSIFAASMDQAAAEDREIEKRAERLAKMAQRIDVDAAQRNLLECQGMLRYAMASRDAELAKKANAEIKDAKRFLAKARARKTSDYMERALRVASKAPGERPDKDEANDTRGNDLTPGEFALERMRYSGHIFIGGVVLDDDALGFPQVTVVAGNLSDRTVEAFDVEIQCWNSFGEPVKSGGNNIVSATCQTPIPEAELHVATWGIPLHETTTKVAVRVTRIKPAYGQLWEQSREEAERSPGAIVTATMTK